MCKVGGSICISIYILGSYEGYVIIILDRTNLMNSSLLKVYLKLVLVHIKLVLVDENSFGTKKGKFGVFSQFQ